MIGGILRMVGPGGIYEHYYHNKPSVTGLQSEKDTFTLNGRTIRILSGAIHYFRVHPTYWEDRLRKLRAAGFNAVETYVPWNLHEPTPGAFDFGDAGNDFSSFLDIVGFLKKAQECDLLVILRPGPYICSEWDFGGLPSWLLREQHMHVRTSEPRFLNPAKNYLKEVLSRVHHLTFPKGGPIIAIQVENEYGGFGYGDLPRDDQYMAALYEHMLSLVPMNQVLYFTSDTPSYTSDLGAIPGVLQTANSQSDVLKEFRVLRELQPESPLMVMEFWCGWFDHWMEPHHNEWPTEDFQRCLEEILSCGASMNLYMFHGGTNFGFMAGANVQNEWPFYAPDVTSYDYDSILTENGDYTPKYDILRKMLKNLNKDFQTPVLLPAIPSTDYPDLQVTRYLSLENILKQVPSIQSPTVLAMEDLPINNGAGQSYGYTLYRTYITIDSEAKLTIQGHVRDLALVMLDGKVISTKINSPEDLDGFGAWIVRNGSLPLSVPKIGPQVLDILVENLGRVNYGKPHSFSMKKGLCEGPVLLNREKICNWTIYPLEFKSSWLQKLSSWKPYDGNKVKSPTLLQGEFEIAEEPKDTFIDACSWGKGVVFVNNFNIGRFWSVGPQRTLYIPAPLLNRGKNKVTIWSQYGGEGKVTFKKSPNLGTRSLEGSTPGSGGLLINIKKINAQNAS
ncbi:unnamed protein product, partial [Meganyctiphanes norvegica]